ncbi:MAG: hypothetical protein ACFFCQ_17210 [Promethearchaeota archaeon]
MMNDNDKVTLTCEPCPICNKSVRLVISKEDIKPSLTGVTTIIDLHGLDKKGLTPHARILYVDERYSVRSFSVVTSFANEA